MHEPMSLALYNETERKIIARCLERHESGAITIGMDDFVPRFGDRNHVQAALLILMDNGLLSTFGMPRMVSDGPFAPLRLAEEQFKITPKLVPVARQLQLEDEETAINSQSPETGTPVADPSNGDDGSAWVAAYEIGWHDHFKNYSAFKRYLDKSDIRQRNPTERTQASAH